MTRRDTGQWLRPPRVERVLERIGYGGPTTPSLEVLADLQRCFLLSVPFENLDIQLGRSLSLASDDLYRKIALRRRGGFCYECNGLFHDLLAALCYRVRYASARMAIGPEVGPEFDHMVLLVDLDLQYLVDVGNQTSPDSLFTRAALATIATREGRVSLTGRRWASTCGAERRERELTSEAEISECLRREFGIELEELPAGLLR